MIEPGIQIIVEQGTQFSAASPDSEYTTNETMLTVVDWDYDPISRNLNDNHAVQGIQVAWKSVHSIVFERIEQDRKWGQLSQGYNRNNPVEWISILSEELGEAAAEANTVHFGGSTEERLKRFREEVVQVAAVALAMIESIDQGWLKE